MKGSHYIKSWSSTKKNVTLSSGEAELVALVKASTEAIGIMQMEKEWNLEVTARILVDSSAALAVVGRKGNGKLRHVKVGSLWVQEKRESGELEYRKVAGEANPADLMTKYLNGNKIERYLESIAHVPKLGRAEASLQVSTLTKVRCEAAMSSKRTGRGGV